MEVRKGTRKPYPLKNILKIQKMVRGIQQRNKYLTRLSKQKKKKTDVKVGMKYFPHVLNHWNQDKTMKIMKKVVNEHIYQVSIFFDSSSMILSFKIMNLDKRDNSTDYR